MIWGFCCNFEGLIIHYRFVNTILYNVSKTKKQQLFNMFLKNKLQYTKKRLPARRQPLIFFNEIL